MVSSLHTDHGSSIPHDSPGCSPLARRGDSLHPGYSSFRSRRSGGMSMGTHGNRDSSSQSFYRANERQIGVLRTGDISEFGRRADSRAGSTMSCGSEDFASLPIGDLMPKNFAGEDASFAGFAGLEGTQARFTSIDITSRPGSLRQSRGPFIPKLSPHNQQRLGMTTYGSMSTMTAIAVPPLDEGRHMIREAVHSSTAGPRGMHSPTTPWLGICDACLFCCMVVLGSAAATNSTRITIASAVFAALADILLQVYTAMALYCDSGNTGAIQLDEKLVASLKAQGWSVEAIASYEDDIQQEELARRRLNKTVGDYAYAVLAHLCGCTLVVAPAALMYAMDDNASVLFLCIVTAVICLTMCVVVRATQVLSTSSQHYIRPKIALLSILFSIVGTSLIVGLGFLLNLAF